MTLLIIALTVFVFIVWPYIFLTYLDYNNKKYEPKLLKDDIVNRTDHKLSKILKYKADGNCIYDK